MLGKRSSVSGTKRFVTSFQAKSFIEYFPEFLAVKFALLIKRPLGNKGSRSEPANSVFRKNKPDIVERNDSELLLLLDEGVGKQVARSRVAELRANNLDAVNREKKNE